MFAHDHINDIFYIVFAISPLYFRRLNEGGSGIERLTPPNIAAMFESTLLQCSDQHCCNVFRTFTLNLKNSFDKVW